MQHQIFNLPPESSMNWTQQPPPSMPPEALPLCSGEIELVEACHKEAEINNGTCAAVDNEYLQCMLQHERMSKRTEGVLIIILIIILIIVFIYHKKRFLCSKIKTDGTSKFSSEMSDDGQSDPKNHQTNQLRQLAKPRSLGNYYAKVQTDTV